MKDKSLLIDFLQARGLKLPSLIPSEFTFYNEESLLLLQLCQDYRRNDLIEVVDFLCKNGAYVNAVSKQGGRNPLMLYYDRYIDDDRYLPDNETLANQDRRWRYALCYSELEELTKLLLNHGLDATHCDDELSNMVVYFMEIAHHLTWEQRVSLGKIIFKRISSIKRSDKCLVFFRNKNVRNSENFSEPADGEALMNIVEGLLDCGFDVNMFDSRGVNLTMYIINRWIYTKPLSRGLGIMQLLIERGGANVKLLSREVPIDVLHLLFGNKNVFNDDFVELVGYLLSQAHWEVSYKSIETLLILTARKTITFSQTMAITDLLVCHGADVHAVDECGENWLMKVCKRKDLTEEVIFVMARFLIEKYGLRVRSDKKDALQLFLKTRFEPYYYSYYLWKKLDEKKCNEKLYYEIVKLLLNSGSKPEAKRNGPIELVCKYYDGKNIADIIHLLGKAGANVNALYYREDFFNEKYYSLRDFLKRNERIKPDVRAAALEALEEYRQSPLKTLRKWFAKVSHVAEALQ